MLEPLMGEPRLLVFYAEKPPVSYAILLMLFGGELFLGLLFGELGSLY